MEAYQHHSHSHQKQEVDEDKVPPAVWILAILVAGLVIFNQVQISSLGDDLQRSASRRSTYSGGSLDLSGVDVNSLKSSAHTMQAVFPIDEISTQEDALAVLFPTGTPDYGEQLGVSFDDPVGSLARLARLYESLKVEVRQNDPEAFQRYIDLATKPVGISCEYCCGVGPVGVSKSGDSLCGCQHNPALLTVALYLTAYTDYSDAEILRETMRWKTLFFPKNMIEMGIKLGGGDTSVLEDLPGMVGGC